MNALQIPLCPKHAVVRAMSAAYTDIPIPEGMDIGDIDKSDEEMEIVILNMRKSLAAAEARISSLEEDIDELNSRRDALEKQRQDTVYKFGAVAEQASLIQKSMDDIANALRKIGGVSKV